VVRNRLVFLPAIADLDHDGTSEVIGASYSLFVLNGDDGDLEIATGHGSGYLHVHGGARNLLWSRQPSSAELRGLSAFDLDGDGQGASMILSARLMANGQLHYLPFVHQAP
jgi:hypothetical protein